MTTTNNNPWIALGSYEEKDAYNFFGRDKDTKNLLNMLLQNDYAVCYAASGDGKSSLINAGLCPCLRKNALFPIKISCTTDEYKGVGVPLKDGNIDFDAFFTKKIEENLKAQEKKYRDKGWSEDNSKIYFEKNGAFKYMQNDKLWWKLRTETIQIPFGEYDYIPVLIFDQFEEFFTATWTKEFFKWLEELSNDSCPSCIFEEATKVVSSDNIPTHKMFKLLLSMRYEYAGELDYYIQQVTYIPLLFRNRYFLKPFTKEQAVDIIKSQAINNPDDTVSAELSNHSEEIANLISKKDQNEISSIILSIVCHELYEQWQKHPDINKIDINEIIFNYYKKNTQSIGISNKAREIIENELISTDKKRLRIPLSKFGNDVINTKTVSELIKLHILRKSVLGDVEYIEFVHDSLVETILYEKEKRYQQKNTGKKKITLIPILVLAVICIAALYFFFSKDKVISNEGFNFTIKLVEEKDIAGKLTWRANLTIITKGHNGIDTIKNITINDEYTDSTFVFNVDSIKSVHCILKFVKNEKVELKNIDKIYYINDLKDNPNITIQICRDTSKYIHYTGKVYTKFNNKNYAIQDALVIVRGTPLETDKNGLFRFKLLDSLRTDENIYIIKEGYNSIETSLRQYEDNQLVYKLESIDSFKSFIDECILIDSMLNNANNPSKEWPYGNSTFFDNSPYPAYLHNGNEDEIVIIAKDKKNSDIKNKDDSDRKEIYGIYYFVKEAKRQKNKYYAYHIFTGYMDNIPFSDKTTSKKYDIESRDIVGNKQIISGGNYYKEGRFFRMSGTIKNHTDTIATFKHK